MELFSKNFEHRLLTKILDAINSYLESQTKPEPRVLGLISAKKLEKELGVKYQTLQRWEDLGLKRYQPPLEDTRKAYYKVSDVLAFLGVEDG